MIAANLTSPSRAVDSSRHKTRALQMELTPADVYAAVMPCPKCGADLLLEATGWTDTVPEGIVVRCIRCGHTEGFGMPTIEAFLRDRLGIQTWLCHGHFDEGCLVVGESLFATTAEKEQLREIIDEEGWDGDAAERLREIESREELVTYYASQHDLDAAYHHAAQRHECGFSTGHPPLNCREFVRWIYTSVNGFLGEFFTVYSLVMVAWSKLLEEIQAELGEKDQSKIKITNETEVRQRFVEHLKEHNRFGYEIIWGQDRPVFINIGGKMRSRKPDVRHEQLIAIELKSFLRFQTYNAAGAKAEVAKAVKKLLTYDGVFGVAFMLCVSDQFSSEQMYAGEPPDFSLPVRWSIRSFVE